jgi:hypothetical protein
VRGAEGAAESRGTVSLSQTKHGGKGSIAAHIIMFMIIRDKTTGDAESTYHFSFPKPKHHPGFAHTHRSTNLSRPYSSMVFVN